MHGARLDVGCRVGDIVLKFVLYAAYVGNHLAVAVVGLIGHIVVDPECSVPAECKHVAVARGIAARHTLNRTVHWHIHTGVGVVDSEPQNTFHSLGHILAQLCHKAESGLLGGNGAFVGVLNTVDGECHRTPAVGHLERAGSDILCHVEGCVLEVVAHSPLHVAHRYRACGLYPQGHRLSLGLVDPGEPAIDIVVGVFLEE